MVAQQIIAVVEDEEAARSAVRWAARNLFRNGDLITLLHVFPSSRSKNKQKQRTRRLNGFQLALSFKELCVGVPEVKVEIIVTEGDQQAAIASLVRQTGASTLLIGLHEKSFIYRHLLLSVFISQKLSRCKRNMQGLPCPKQAHDAMADYEAARSFISGLNCRLLAVKQPSVAIDTSTSVEFSQIETCLPAKKPMSVLSNLSGHDLEIEEKKMKLYPKGIMHSD
ncbi:hypothetical protein ACLOJK_032406 [Asimina triloba]